MGGLLAQTKVSGTIVDNTNLPIPFADVALKVLVKDRCE
jgi:hypothetical protein